MAATSPPKPYLVAPTDGVGPDRNEGKKNRERCKIRNSPQVTRDGTSPAPPNSSWPAIACKMPAMPGLFDGTPLERPVTCEVCEQPLDQCTCPRDEAGAVLLPKDQPARIRREKRRAGKIVTVITGLNPAASDLQAILRQLKSACAAGGRVSEGIIEIQGDHRERILAILQDLGYPAKLSGG